MLRKVLRSSVALMLLALPASAQTVDELLAKYVKAIGGMEKVSAIQTYRMDGRVDAGGFTYEHREFHKRPEFVRQEDIVQRMTGIYAYDGRTGWKIEPWQGKKDAEALGEEEMKGIIEDSDFDGPLVNPQAKGHKVEYVGKEPVDGDDTYKLKVTLKGGDVKYFYLDPDYFVPVKVETKRTVRGAEREYETILGDYKEVAGVYMPHYYEINAKGSPNKQKVTFEKIEANVSMDDAIFAMPRSGAPPASAEKKPETVTKKQNGKKGETQKTADEPKKKDK